MTLRESMAVGWAPVFLRLMLGVTFVWAGLAKVVGEAEFTGEGAATLANYGVISGPSVATMDPVVFLPADLQDEQDERRPDNREPDGSPPPALDDDDLQDDAPVAPPLAPSGPDRVYTAADFGDSVVKTRGLHNITVLLHNAMKPGVNSDTAESTMPLWFDVDATRDYDPWPVYFAWAVAGTELIGGGFLLLGLLTRLSALGIAGTMVGAIWLTTIGPAIQTGQTQLGFLPDHAGFDIKAWQGPMWQFSLLMSSLALFCTGSGGAAIDRLLFGNPFFYKPAPAKKSDG